MNKLFARMIDLCVSYFCDFFPNIFEHCKGIYRGNFALKFGNMADLLFASCK